ncbi:MAG: uracil-DNA glycosylase [bacterium]
MSGHLLPLSRMTEIPAGWRSVLANETSKPYFHALQESLAEERKRHAVFPPEEEVFSALTLTPFRRVDVVLLGQDPYHGEGQAHGLCFSVKPGVAPPPSLVNIFKELKADVGVPTPNNGYLAAWARRGILMLNTVLTVRGGQPGSHRGKGWECFTDAIIRLLNARADTVVFALWGHDAMKKAQVKAGLIDKRRHAIVIAPHPSPMSTRGGFLGSRPFSRINAALRRVGKPEIDWRIPNL